MLSRPKAEFQIGQADLDPSYFFLLFIYNICNSNN